MGKIRVKTLGNDQLEKEQKKEVKKRQEAKSASRVIKAPGLKGGQRVASVGPSEEELLKETAAKTTALVEKEEVPLEKEKAKKKIKQRTRSKRYTTVAKLVDRTKKYPLFDALALLPKIHIAKFDESVELHINTIEQGISGNVMLPHGTGKKVRVTIADEKIIEEIAKGKISFDVLLADPMMMPKLAKVAKILGPKGLMPNPKNGTITTAPQQALKKFEAGQIRFKTEAKAPIIHLTIGKLSFDEKKLTDNIISIVSAIQKQNIKNITLKSTMSPGIKLDISTA